jgi:hypothetical protein
MRVQLRNVAGLDEAGIDGGGLFREFLTELLKTAFDPNRGFFKLTRDHQLYPNPSIGHIEQNYLPHYFFIGRMLGKVSIFITSLEQSSDIKKRDLPRLEMLGRYCIPSQPWRLPRDRQQVACPRESPVGLVYLPRVLQTW